MDLLRNELHHYGEILVLLDQQQEFVISQAADDVIRSVTGINQQMTVIQQARREREACQAQVARTLREPEDSAFATLIPRLPEAVRSAVAALVRENNDLLIRVQQRARQNHLLLSRSLEMMQQFIHALLPAPPPTTYNGTGQLQSPEAPALPVFQAVG